MANTYNYVDTSGKLQQVQADNTDSAMKLATNRDSQSGFQLVTTPSQNNSGAITMDQMTPPKKIVTPQVTPDTTDYGNTTKTASETAASNLAELTKRRDEERTKREAESKDIISKMQYISDNKTLDTRNAEIASGVDSETEKFNTYIERLTGLNAEASSLDREALAIPLQVQENARGQGVTDAGAAPDVASKLRLNAIKALTIAQQSDIASAAATGSLNKLNLAKDKAKQIVDLKYKPLEDTLNIKIKQYEMNKDILDGIDKDRSEALAVALNEQKAELENKKADEKAKMDLITGAAPYAPQSLLEQAQNAPDATSAAIILGQYGKDYLATQKTKQEIIKLQIENGTYNENETGISGLITKDNGFSFEDYKRGIAAVESGGSGGYSALGPVMASGAYKGDRAYGKYQVMGGNIPAWTKSALGYSMTPQQFLASADAQEKVFEDQSNKTYAKYGNWDDVASVWFSGQPLSGNTKSDGYNNTQQYVAKVRKGMGVTEPTQISIPGIPDKVIKNVINNRVAGGQLVSATTGDVPKNVTSAQQDGLLALSDLVKKTEEYKALYTNLANEGATGYLGTGLVKGVKNSIAPSVNATALESLRSEITDLLARARSGAALTAFETAQYEAKLPTSYSADQIFGNPQTTIDGLKSSLANTLDTKMKGYGIVFAPTVEEIYAKRIDASRNGTTSGSPGVANSESYGYY
jgi:hypothetical protein